MSIEIKSDILAKELNQGIVPLGVPKAYQYDAALVEAARAAVNQGLDDVAEAGATAKVAIETQKTASVNAVSAQEQASKADVNALGDKILAQMKHGYGYPFTAATAAEMTDTAKIYVYTGAETGYTNGNWYYWNGTAWTSGGVYQATALETDKTLTISGAAADAKAVGDKVDDILDGEIFTDSSIKNAKLHGFTTSFDDNYTWDNVSNLFNSDNYYNGKWINKNADGTYTIIDSNDLSISNIIHLTKKRYLVIKDTTIDGGGFSYWQLKNGVDGLVASNIKSQGWASDGYQARIGPFDADSYIVVGFVSASLSNFKIAYSKFTKLPTATKAVSNEIATNETITSIAKKYYSAIGVLGSNLWVKPESINYLTGYNNDPYVEVNIPCNAGDIIIRDGYHNLGQSLDIVFLVLTEVRVTYVMDVVFIWLLLAPVVYNSLFLREK